MEILRIPYFEKDNIEIILKKEILKWERKKKF